ncbi:MAG: primosomal protein N' [Sphingomonadaceae bacterium]
MGERAGVGAAGGRVSVLLVGGRLGRFDYAVPEGLALAPGDVVEVPLGPRRVAGIVWDGPADGKEVPDSRLKPVVRRLPVPAMTGPMRRLVDWVADWYLAEAGQVARMALPAVALAGPPAPVVRHAGVRPAGVKLPAARRALLEQILADGGARTLSEWAERTGASRVRLQALVKAGLLAPVPDAADRPALPPGPALSAPQAEAARVLAEAVAAGGFQPFLLDGVTGSGKTEVYFEAVAAAVAAGGQALVLLPEIALTEPWLQRFVARFGFAPHVWHSSAGVAARRRTFHGAADGQARVIVGARSALFLPMRQLRLLVVDEAHDAAFKQEEGVFYHARDVAVVRAREEGVPVVLATATPSLETVENVAQGRYRRLALPDRFGGAALPQIRLVDMLRHPPARGRWLSPPLVAAVDETLARGEQALLFLNRRGYAPLTLCRACGARMSCPNCTAWMVEHRLERRLLCHHCGHAMPVPPACPACGAEGALVPCGPGVERVAEEVAARWPQARLAIATSDTVPGARAAAALFARIDAREIDILVGTQMLAKGHDFRGLTLVGVVDADLGLAGGDLRAGERTFAQLAQVAGRAGRGAQPGTVLIQTHQPHAPLMQALARGDRDAFLATEREARRAAGMPPFGRLVALILSATDPHLLEAAAQTLALAAPRGEGLSVYGPAPAPLAMLRGRHRIRFLVHGRERLRLQEPIRAWLAAVRLPSSVRLTIDVDPQSFL